MSQGTDCLARRGYMHLLMGWCAAARSVRARRKVRPGARGANPTCGTTGRRPSSGRPMAAWAAVCLAVFLAAGGSRVQGADPHRATSSRAARHEAMRAVPMQHLSEEDRHRVQTVIDSTSLYRHMPTKLIDCDPHLFLFLLENPDVIVNIWEVLGVSNVALKRLDENTFLATDGHGTKGRIEVLYSHMDRQLIYAQGRYESPLMRHAVEADCVLLLRAAYLRSASGRRYVRASLDAFVQFQRAGPNLFAKTFQPLLGKVADYNFTETMDFVSRLSRTSERQPKKMTRLYEKLDKVDAETRRQLLQIPLRLAQRAADRAARGRPQKQYKVRRTKASGQDRTASSRSL